MCLYRALAPWYLVLISFANTSSTWRRRRFPFGEMGIAFSVMIRLVLLINEWRGKMGLIFSEMNCQIALSACSLAAKFLLSICTMTTLNGFACPIKADFCQRY